MDHDAAVEFSGESEVRVGKMAAQTALLRTPN